MLLKRLIAIICFFLLIQSVTALADEGKEEKVPIIIVLNSQEKSIASQQQSILPKLKKIQAEETGSSREEKREFRKKLLGQMSAENSTKAKEILRIVRECNGIETGKIDSIGAVTAIVPKNCIEKLKKNNLIEKIVLDKKMSFALDVSGSVIGKNSWIDNNFDGNGIIVGVIDTGVKAHPNITITASSVFHDTAKTDTENYYDFNDSNDYVGHGTAIAGIIDSNNETYKGIAPKAGIINAKFGYRTKDGEASGWFSDAMKAIDWSIANGADILNFSFGSEWNNDDSEPAKFVDSIIDSFGIPITIAAGNSGPNAKTITDPAIAYNGISVGNLNDKDTNSKADDTINSTSSRGKTIGNRIKPDLIAPGTSITTTNLNKEFEAKNGTSVSAPHVAGAIALLLDYNKSLSALQIKALLLNSADNNNSFSIEEQGFGLIDLNKAFIQKEFAIESAVEKFSSKAFRINLKKGEKITAAWNRHAKYNGIADYPIDVNQLSNIDLELFDENNNSLEKDANSVVDNAEQLIAVKDMNAIIKVVLKTNVLQEKFGIGFPGQATVITVDSAKPIVELIIDSNKISGKKSFNVKAIDSISGIKRIKIMLDENIVEDKSISDENSFQRNYEFQLNTVQLQDGNHQLKAIALDANDNNAFAEKTIEVSNSKTKILNSKAFENKLPIRISWSNDSNSFEIKAYSLKFKYLDTNSEWNSLDLNNDKNYYDFNSAADGNIIGFKAIAIYSNDTNEFFDNNFDYNVEIDLTKPKTSTIAIDKNSFDSNETITIDVNFTEKNPLENKLMLIKDSKILMQFDLNSDYNNQIKIDANSLGKGIYFIDLNLNDKAENNNLVEQAILFFIDENTRKVFSDNNFSEKDANTAKTTLFENAKIDLNIGELKKQAGITITTTKQKPVDNNYSLKDLNSFIEIIPSSSLKEAINKARVSITIDFNSLTEEIDKNKLFIYKWNPDTNKWLHPKEFAIDYGTDNNQIWVDVNSFSLFSVEEDKTKPSIQISNPTNNSTINIDSTTISIIATDESGIKKYYYRKNNEEWISSSQNTYAFTSLGNGTHTFYTIATDNADNNSEIASAQITVSIPASTPQYTGGSSGGGGGSFIPASTNTTAEKKEEPKKIDENKQETMEAKAKEETIIHVPLTVEKPSIEKIRELFELLKEKTANFSTANFSEIQELNSKILIEKTIAKTTENETTIIITIKPTEEIGKTRIIEKIPKEIIESTRQIKSNQEFEIIQEDPVIGFRLNWSQKNKETIISYAILKNIHEKELEKIETIALPIIEKEETKTETIPKKEKEIKQPASNKKISAAGFAVLPSTIQSIAIGIGAFLIIIGTARIIKKRKSRYIGWK